MNEINTSVIRKNNKSELLGGKTPIFMLNSQCESMLKGAQTSHNIHLQIKNLVKHHTPYKGTPPKLVDRSGKTRSGQSMKREEIRGLFKANINDYFIRQEIRNQMGVLMNPDFRQWLIKAQSEQYAKLLNNQSCFHDSVSSIDEEEMG